MRADEVQEWTCLACCEACDAVSEQLSLGDDCEDCGCPLEAVAVAECGGCDSGHHHSGRGQDEISEGDLAYVSPQRPPDASERLAYEAAARCIEDALRSFPARGNR